MTTDMTATPAILDRPYAPSDDAWGSCHVPAETVWKLSDPLTELAKDINPHDLNGEHGFHRQATLLAYAAELKAAAAAHLDAEDGAQCRARLAEIAADEACREKSQAARAAEQAGQSPPQMHA